VIDDYGLMPHASEEHVIRASASGFVTDLDAGLIGRAVVMLGGGRDKVDDEIDPGVGIMIPATVGDAVRTGDAVLRVRYTSEDRLEDALPLLMEAVRVGESPRPRTPLIIDQVL
jgi:pyrimidine-nucleoside phosphorylase